jgi:hypothetical protein
VRRAAVAMAGDIAGTATTTVLGCAALAEAAAAAAAGVGGVGLGTGLVVREVEGARAAAAIWCTAAVTCVWTEGKV